MRSRNLALLLAGCALFASWPIVVWAIARFGWIDDRFVASLGSLSFSLPVGMAAAALVLVGHGLLVNRELYDLLELDEVDEEEQIIRGREAAVAAAMAPTPVGAAAGPNIVTVSGGTATATAAPPVDAAAAAQTEEVPSKYGNKMAVAERKNQGFRDKDGKKPKKASRVKRTAKSMASRGKYAGKGAASRALRDNIRFPRF